MMSDSLSQSASSDIVVVNTGDAIDLIRSTGRALLFISVSWSGPERKARKVFEDTARLLATLFPSVPIGFFRLEVDENEALQDWVTSLGYPEFVIMGAGSILWLEYGKVVGTLPTANVGMRGIVEQTVRHWDSKRTG